MTHKPSRQPAEDRILARLRSRLTANDPDLMALLAGDPNGERLLAETAQRIQSNPPPPGAAVGASRSRRPRQGHHPRRRRGSSGQPRGARGPDQQVRRHRPAREGMPHPRHRRAARGLRGPDRLEALALDTSDAMVTRQVQRIEQGMGRGVRSNDDHCVVLLLGSRLTQRLYSAGGLARFSPATRSQLKLSHEVADMLHGRPFTDLASVIDQCLNRDSGWVSASKNALDGLTYDTTATVSETAIAERKAFGLAVLGQHRQAAQILQTAIDALGEPRLRGWLKQQAAAYQHHHDPVPAQQMLLSALSDNPALTKPRVGISYDRLPSHGDQAKRCAEHMATYSAAGDMLVGLAAILDDLIPDPSRTDKFEQAWNDLGLFLGFAAQRPERDTGQGTASFSSRRPAARISAAYRRGAIC
jgi:hypothetical protein